MEGRKGPPRPSAGSKHRWCQLPALVRGGPFHLLTISPPLDNYRTTVSIRDC